MTNPLDDIERIDREEAAAKKAAAGKGRAVVRTPTELKFHGAFANKDTIGLAPEDVPPELQPSPTETAAYSILTTQDADELPTMALPTLQPDRTIAVPTILAVTGPAPKPYNPTPYKDHQNKSDIFSGPCYIRLALNKLNPSKEPTASEETIERIVSTIIDGNGQKSIHSQRTTAVPVYFTLERKNRDYEIQISSQQKPDSTGVFIPHIENKNDGKRYYTIGYAAFKDNADPNTPRTVPLQDFRNIFIEYNRVHGENDPKKNRHGRPGPFEPRLIQIGTTLPSAETTPKYKAKNPINAICTEVYQNLNL